MKDYNPPNNLLKERVIIVTGAGGGIGRAAALAFAEYGATVVLLGKHLEELERVYDEIENAGFSQPALYPMDLEAAGPAEHQALATCLEENFGRLDGILHNAALLGTLCPIEHYDAKLWYQVMQINLHAPFLMTKACLPLLKRASDAAVVFTSDRVGRKGYAYWGAYGVAKFGIEGLMQMLAEEVENSSHIRVNSINPGPTRTLLRASAYPGEDPNSLLKPEELMSSYLYLMGPDSQGVHGQALDAQS